MFYDEGWNKDKDKDLKKTKKKGRKKFVFLLTVNRYFLILIDITYTSFNITRCTIIYVLFAYNFLEYR